MASLLTGRNKKATSSSYIFIQRTVKTISLLFTIILFLAMADENEKILLEALASSGFKVSVHDKKRTEAEEKKTVIENKQQCGEDPNPEASNDDKNNDNQSLLSIVKSMSAEQRRKVIETLKQGGLGDPLTKEKLVQNAFTVDKTIRDNAKN